MKLPTLYKTTSTGKLQEWSIEVEDHGSFARYTVTHGQRGGKLQTTHTDITKGKNIGRANETSPYEQAVSEAQSQWNKKKDRRGYSEGAVVTAGSTKKFRPMLAKSYNHPEHGLDSLKDGKHIIYPCYIQPKLDGIRCNTNRSAAYSRQGKKFKVLSHIVDKVSQINNTGFEFIDGELYNHQNKDNFQEIVSAVKRDEPNHLTNSIEYHVYDVVINNMHFEDRMKWIEDNITPCDVIKVVPSHLIVDPEELKNKYYEFIGMGYEGAIVRNKKGFYKVDGRSADLQKVKEFQEQEFPIVGAYENKGKQAGQCTFVCETPDGTTFGVKPKGTEEERSQYWKDWNNGTINSGDLLTVAFFSMTTSENPVPRFPIGKSIRNYE